MHGGIKFYRGAAKAARDYVEADRSRADDYYLTEGTGVAERLIATPDGVERGGVMGGDTYEKWVAGADVRTGRAKGRLLKDRHALRFVEVTINGPKTWSLAAALHPEISAALDAAQDRAAAEIIGYLAQHATTRIGPRGRQTQVPVEKIEAAVIRHYTSRAGAPPSSPPSDQRPGLCDRWLAGPRHRGRRDGCGPCRGPRSGTRD